MDWPQIVFVDLAQLIVSSDLISLHCPLNEQTTQLVDHPLLDAPHIARGTAAARRRLLASAKENRRSFVEGDQQNRILWSGSDVLLWPRRIDISNGVLV